MGLRRTGGEGGILLPPLPASTGESYTSAITLCLRGLQGGKAAAGQHPPLEPHTTRVWRALDAKSQAMVLEAEQPK
jgi:hypothetical protein